MAETAPDLLILAMDHRDSLQRDVYDIDGEPTAEQRAHIAHGKALIFDGLLRAVADGVAAARVGVLVDEQFGASVAERAKGAGIDLAMPIERSGQKLFELEYGSFDSDEWLRHVQRFDPDQVKLLVRDNPDDDSAARATQFERLALVSRALATAGRTFLVELLVPATDAQLASVGGDTSRYDAEVRPGLTVRVIEEMQAQAIEPDIWKIEGLETTDAATSVVAAARAGGRDAVTCIVLGRDAPRDRLDHWLAVAAPVDGFRGFAIGRSIWEEPLVEQLAGRASEDELIARVAANFTHFAELYQASR
jgi:myo-inositol catabolism protein IolC